MELIDKLEILADAAKYDVACTLVGHRTAQRRRASWATPWPPAAATASRPTDAASRCSSAHDQRVRVRLRLLREPRPRTRCRAQRSRRASWRSSPSRSNRRNYIEGLFLSSGVVRDPDHTTELMVRTLSLLRNEHGFRGYIHAKAVPGTSPELIEALGHLADRMSVNMELPSQRSLALLAPEKDKQRIVTPMRQIRDGIAEDRDNARDHAPEHRLPGAEAARAQRARVRAGRSVHADDRGSHAPRATSRYSTCRRRSTARSRSNGCSSAPTRP